MVEQVNGLKTEIEAYRIQSETDLEAFRLKFIAKKGVLAELFTQLKDSNPTEKKALGKVLNDLKESAQQKYDMLSAQLKQATKQMGSSTEDLTLPPPNDSLGALHPLTLVKYTILRLFEKIGFTIADGPEIEDDWHNFGALNFPPNHPARDMMDTFFVDQDPVRLLRTHTTSVQIRIAEQQTPPIRSITVGRVYRNETISARAHCIFHQVDGFYINHQVSFAELKQTLLYFIKGLFGPEVNMRLRPSYFPFTEPSVEVDIDCRVCQGKGCNVCKYSGWVEIMGGGMIDPAVLQNCQIDPVAYTGFAFGMGIERIAMLLYEMNDLRLFTENDLRFLKQFTSQA
jgi:phenylalanyl-tRNA synthetase alpha chain